MFNPWIQEHVEWSFQITRLLGEASQGGGEAHELLRLVSQMRLGQANDWYESFFGLAEQLRGLAEEAEEGSHRATARSHYLRACNYYRASELLLEAGDERRRGAFDNARASFARAAPLFDPPIEPVTIPFDGMSLPGYFCLPSEGRQARNPAVLYIAGADVYKETLLFLGGAEALRRGFALLMMDGPGQGEMIRLHNVRAQPDYDRPAGAALGFLQSRPEVDAGRLAIVGRSFGGYYGARTAAFDDRVKACVLFGALYDALKFYEGYARISSRRQRYMQWLVGADGDDAAARQCLAQFNLSGIVERIRCPTLVVHAEDDPFVAVSEAQQVYDELGGPKAIRLIKSGEPGSAHCQYDDFPRTLSHIFDWLRDQLG
ncbi:MAG: alpha/beta hydrolase [Anaerolineales bacterium]|nr:alpha/beta hydrolase [Anaerolineales bacterium]